MTATTAQADLGVTFRNGNPPDRFWVQNMGCRSITGVLSLDLDGDVGWWPAPNVGVENPEMAGARATLEQPSGTTVAIFDPTATARFAPQHPKPCHTAPDRDLVSDTPLIG